MSETQVSITCNINDEDALNRASLFFSGLALDASGKGVTVTHPKPVTAIDATQSVHNNVITETGDIVEEVETTTPDTGFVSEVNIGEGVELDSEGLPWDARIGSVNKGKKADGTWKVARNMDKDLVAKVKAELRGVVETPTVTEPVETTPTPPSAPVVEAPQPELYIVGADRFTESQLIEAGWSTDQIADLRVYAPVADITFPEFMSKVTKAIAAEELEQSQVDLACQREGVTTVALLVSQPDKIPAINNTLFG